MLIMDPLTSYSSVDVLLTAPLTAGLSVDTTVPRFCCCRDFAGGGLTGDREGRGHLMDACWAQWNVAWPPGSLTRNGLPSGMGLRGQVVRIRDQVGWSLSGLGRVVTGQVTGQCVRVWSVGSDLVGSSQERIGRDVGAE